MKKTVQIKTLKERCLLAAVVLIFGFIMIVGLFFWYKSFAYFMHSIYTYQIDQFTEELDSENRQIVMSYSGLKRYCETVIVNNSPSDITVDIYDNVETSTPVLLQNNLMIASGKEYRFASYEYSYKVIVQGRDVTEDNIIVEASTIPYLKEYRLSVIVTMIIGIAMIGIWDLLILTAPGFTEKYGAKINIWITLFSAIGSVLSSIIFYRGYYESNLCFIALLCTVLTFVLMKRENYRAYKDQNVTIDEIYMTAGAISLFLSCMMLLIMYNSTDTSLFYAFNARNKMSLPDYVITVVAFFLFFLILSRIFLKKQKAVSFMKYYCNGKDILICIPAVAAAFFAQQSNLRMAGNIGYSVLSLVISAILLYGLMHCKLVEQTSGKGHHLIILPIYILFIVINTISTTVINYFHMGERTWNYIHHMGWYYRSIYYVVNNLPYPDKEIGLYGHYQLFYNIPMKIFGTNLLTIGIVTGIAGGLTAFFVVGIIHMLTKSDFLRVIGIIAALNILCSHLYIAIVPHRLLFPMMMLFLIVYCRKKEIKWFHILIGIVIGLLSVIWNTEVGVVTILSWIAFLILKKSAGKDHSLGYVIKTALLTLLALGIVVAAVFEIVLQISKMSNVSSSTVLADVFSIMADTDFMFTNHFNFIRWTNSPWIYILMLFLGMAAFGISRMGLLGVDRDKEKNMPIVISTAVMGLGLMVYFISRPEDYSIIMLPAIFLVLFILDENLKILTLTDEESIQENKLILWKKILCIFLILGLGCIISRTGEVVKGVWSRGIEQHQLDYNLFLEDLNMFALEVPKESYVPFRQDDGLTEIYMCLGWELPEENNTEYCISTSNNMSDEGNYTFVKEIMFGDIHYYLYRNNSYNQ